jgi:hypothetical protein
MVSFLSMPSEENLPTKGIAPPTARYVLKNGHHQPFSPPWKKHIA